MPLVKLLIWSVMKLKYFKTYCMKSMDNFRYIGAEYKTASEKAKPLLHWVDVSVASYRL